MKNVKVQYLLIIKFCTKNMLYNFYVKRTITEKNVYVTKNVDCYKFSFQLFFNFQNDYMSYQNIVKNVFCIEFYEKQIIFCDFLNKNS